MDPTRINAVEGQLELLENLFAARTPGHPGLFPDDAALINVIRLLANGYLGGDYPPLPYHAYLENGERFIEVQPGP